jgi:cytoskeletal protein RodZ
VGLFSLILSDQYNIHFDIVDALYEAAGKQTYLAMIVDFLLGVLVLIGLVLSYRHLQPEEHGYRELSHSSDSDSSSSRSLSSSTSSPSSESDADGGLELTAKAKEEDSRTSFAADVATTRV